MESRVPPLISPTSIVKIGVAVTVVCGTILVTSAASGWGLTAAAIAVAILLGVTYRIADQAGEQIEYVRELETEARLLKRQFDRLSDVASHSLQPDTTPANAELANTDLTGAIHYQFADMANQCRRLQVAFSDLLNERERLTVVLENLDSGVVVIAPHGNIVLANHVAEKFFANSATLAGRLLAETIRFPDLLAAVRLVARDRSPREVVVDLHDDAGARRVLRILCVLVPYEDDSSAVLLVANDESEIRQVEETRREFVANVSHELKTPLAAIKGYVETVELAIQDDPEAARYFVSQISDQCRRLESLVSDMLTLARAQAGTQNLRLTAVDLQAVIAEAIATYTPVAGAKRISLTHDRAETPTVMVRADREATITIANNVIGNAIRYTLEGGQVVATACLENGFGVISVRDTGIGIPEHEQRRVFERFYRTEQSRRHAGSGTGLGLAIVKNLTQAQGGQVRLWSQPGEGSKFDILLPVKAAVASPIRLLDQS